MGEEQQALVLLQRILMNNNEILRSPHIQRPNELGNISSEDEENDYTPNDNSSSQNEEPSSSESQECQDMDPKDLDKWYRK